MSFVPPDGRFELFSYHVSRTNQLPLYVNPVISFSANSAARSCFVLFAKMPRSRSRRKNSVRQSAAGIAGSSSSSSSVASSITSSRECR